MAKVIQGGKAVINSKAVRAAVEKLDELRRIQVTVPRRFGDVEIDIVKKPLCNRITPE